MALYEVACLSKPSKNDSDAGQVERLIWGPLAIVAADEKSAVAAACSGKEAPSHATYLVRLFQ